MSAFPAIAQAIDADVALWPDFNAFCDMGGRMAGAGGDEAAAGYAMRALAAMGARVGRADVVFPSWRATVATLAADDGESLACRALLRSADTPIEGLRAPVLDLGRGTPEDFAVAGERVRGRIALVRHEYPFSATHVHRRRKYDAAVAAGAAGFVIANPEGGVLSGSSGRAPGGHGIPSAYTDAAGLARLAASGERGATLAIRGVEQPGTAPIVVADFPGASDEWVVLSAHLDGHDLAESALDDATGLAAALAIARAMAPHLARASRGLRVCLFSAEEWGLAGSAKYLEDLHADDRARIKLNVNLDTVAGDDVLTALTSGFTALEPLIARAAATAGVPIGTHLPLMSNSDHANFARAGIPALRLIAGFDRPASNVRHILSALDRRDLIAEADLRRAARAAAAICALGVGLA